MTTKRTLISTRLSAAADDLDWDGVYEAYVARVYNFFLYRLNDPFQAEDLTSTTFVRAWKSKHHYRKDLGAISTWLFTIARRTAAEHYRKTKPTSSLENTLETAEPSLEEAVSHALDIVRVRHLLAELPPRDQELVALKFGAGLTNREIAPLMGLSESNVSTILHRLVQQLRKRWEE